MGLGAWGNDVQCTYGTCFLYNVTQKGTQVTEYIEIVSMCLIDRCPDIGIGGAPIHRKTAQKHISEASKKLLGISFGIQSSHWFSPTASSRDQTGGLTESCTCINLSLL